MSTPTTPPPPPAGYGQQVPDPDLAHGHQTGLGQPGPVQQPTGHGQMPGVPDYALFPRATGQPGRIRPTGTTILLVVVTLGIWAFVYYYQVHEEMRRHSGQGLGGVLALLICVVFGLVNPFLLSNEVGQLYERQGREKPVSALTGLWFFPGLFILVGPFVWFVKTNNALNEYWRGLGVTETTLV